MKSNRIIKQQMAQYHKGTGNPPSTDDNDWEFVTLHAPAKNGDSNNKGRSNKHSETPLSSCNIGVLYGDCTKNVTPEQIDCYRKAFARDRMAVVAQNAVCNGSLTDLTLRRELLQTSLSPYFSINLDHGGMPVTNQKDSGRCWMFGTFNLFRFGTRAKLGLDDFEFSESYLYFFYLLEQANWFLQFIIDTADNSNALDDRIVADMIDEPIGDGGDWGIAVVLIEKYGLVPKTLYPESCTSSSTWQLLNVLTTILQSTACQIRNMLHANDDDDDDRTIEQQQAACELKERTVADVWRVLCIHLGTPPTRFGWTWRDNNGAFHQTGTMTPLEFSREYVTVPYDSYVSLIQDPRHPYYHRYTVQYNVHICGERPIIFLNIPVKEMKDMSLAMLRDGLPVWFACNVDEECDNEHGLWDVELYDLYGLYGICKKKYEMNKADKIRYGGTMGTHVMLFTGVDDVEDAEQDGRRRRWRVENSWGTDDAGNDGYYTMNDSWFDDNVFEIVAPPQYLSKKAAAALQTEPIVLPAWDPMWSSNRGSSKMAGRRSHLGCKRR